MHSTIVRAQNVFGYFTTVIFFVALAIGGSVYILPQAPNASVELRNVQVVKGRPHYYSSRREEYAHIRFDLDLDLTSLFNWNTKQVFVYVKATYPPSPSSPPDTPRSEAIIWDAILASPMAPWHENFYVDPTSRAAKPSKYQKKGKSAANRNDHVTPNPGKLMLSNQRPKYQISDVSASIASQPGARLELGYNVQPWVGALTWADSAGLPGFWKKLRGGKGGKGRSDEFTFPQVKQRDTKPDLGTMKGGEGNRGKPS